MTRIRILEGDITDQEVDAIVNAANSDLILGSGVAGAIAERGGPAIADECAAKGPIAVGEVALTCAGDLSARFVIHAASMQPRGRSSEESVRSVLRAAFLLAENAGCVSIACPAIGTGVGGLSMQACAEISLAEARHYSEQSGQLEEIRFVLFGEPAFRLFEMVDDAVKVEVQMRKLQERKTKAE